MTAGAEDFDRNNTAKHVLSNNNVLSCRARKLPSGRW
jgi:hypothetical protein